MRKWLALLFLATLLAGCTTSPTASKTPGAEEVVSRLKAAGLPIGEVVVYAAETDPNKLLGRPNQYTSKANFQDTRLGGSASIDNGGSVEVFANKADLEARQKYIAELAKAAPLFVEYDASAGLVLLRLGHALTPDQSAQYTKALNEIK